MLRTSLPARAVARVLASIVRRVMAGSSSGPVFAVVFGGPVSVSIGDACLCTVADADGGVSIDWAPDSGEAQSFLLPLLDAALGA
ncbi:MAG: hypothetical protein IKE76_00775 [Clostridia bacterium]|nr:hypothetical protein [Clostridia bacterium]